MSSFKETPIFKDISIVHSNGQYSNISATLNEDTNTQTSKKKRYLSFIDGLPEGVVMVYKGPSANEARSAIFKYIGDKI